MPRICPQPNAWSRVFDRLTRFATGHPCTPPSPPMPLILGGWTYSNDIEKTDRWNETLRWAAANGCGELVATLDDEDFYVVEAPTTYGVGPSGVPMYRTWTFSSKPRVSPAEATRLLEHLRENWPRVAGELLAGVTRPVCITGVKARRLLVHASPGSRAPWGSWSSLSTEVAERRTFTRLRASVNTEVAPHEIDHIDFTTDA